MLRQGIRMGVVHALLLLGMVNVGSVGLAAMSVSAESGNQVYGLDMIVDLALAKNPVISFAEGTIEQQKGQQTAAGAYPNPTVSSNSGRGRLRDTNVEPPENIQSLTEYSVTVGQPVEWPALRAARQRVADLGLATASVGMLETRLNLVSQVKVAFYDLLLAQQEANDGHYDEDIQGRFLDETFAVDAIRDGMEKKAFRALIDYVEIVVLCRVGNHDESEDGFAHTEGDDE